VHLVGFIIGIFCVSLVPVTAFFLMMSELYTLWFHCSWYLLEHDSWQGFSGAIVNNLLC